MASVFISGKQSLYQGFQIATELSPEEGSFIYDSGTKHHPTLH